METNKEVRSNRKFKARKAVSSSKSEEESFTEVIISSPSCPPAKRKYKQIYYVHSTYVYEIHILHFLNLYFILKSLRLHDKNEFETSPITCSGDSAKRYSKSGKISNSSGFGSRIDN